MGVDVNTKSDDLYPHATALHQAVCSKSLETVKVLVEAGARLDVADTAHGDTPLGWAQYGGDGYEAIVDYLGRSS